MNSGSASARKRVGVARLLCLLSIILASHQLSLSTDMLLETSAHMWAVEIREVKQPEERRRLSELFPDLAEPEPAAPGAERVAGLAAAVDASLRSVRLHVGLAHLACLLIILGISVIGAASRELTAPTRVVLAVGGGGWLVFWLVRLITAPVY